MLVSDVFYGQVFNKTYPGPRDKYLNSDKIL